MSVYENLHGGDLRGGEIKDFFRTFYRYANNTTGGLRGLLISFVPVFQISEGCQSRLTDFLAYMIFIIIIYKIFNTPELNWKTKYKNIGFLVNQTYREFAQSTSRIIRVLWLFCENVYDLIMSFIKLFRSKPEIIQDPQLKESVAVLNQIFDYADEGLQYADKGVGIMTLQDKFAYVKDTIFSFLAHKSALLFKSLHYVLCGVLNIIETVVGSTLSVIVTNLLPNFTEEYFNGFHAESDVAGFILELLAIRDIVKYVDYYKYRKGAKVWAEQNGMIVYKQALVVNAKGSFDDPFVWAPIYWDGTEWKIYLEALNKPKRRGSRRL